MPHNERLAGMAQEDGGLALQCSRPLKRL